MIRKFSRHIFEYNAIINFQEPLSSESQVVPFGQTDGRTDRHDNAHSRFSQFSERAKKTNAGFQNIFYCGGMRIQKKSFDKDSQINSGALYSGQYLPVCHRNGEKCTLTIEVIVSCQSSAHIYSRPHVTIPEGNNINTFNTAHPAVYVIYKFDVFHPVMYKTILK
jgi:hypothetical protein